MAPRSIEPRGSRSRLSSLNSHSEAQDRDLPSDLDEEGGLTGEDDDSVLDFSSSLPPNNPHSLASSYRRPSFFTMGPRGTVVPHEQCQEGISEQERERAIEEERSLLQENHVIPPDRVRDRSPRVSKKISGLLSRTLKSSPDGQSPPQRDSDAADEESGIGPDDETPDYAAEISERTTLLGIPAPSSDEYIDQKWEEAVAAGLIQTTWRREAKVLSGYSFPLMAAFLLQYSLTVASIFTVGHIGKVELGAVSLASMTASITGYAVYQGLATSLDTLCAQAYGSGRKQLVGLQMQRMVYFLWVMTIPIGIIWLLADKILMKIVPEKDVAVLAGQYLKVVLIGAPGLACFESGKRYVQAQGLFSASLYVLLICAPLNAFMNWLFVWQFGWGFIGAPIAVAITDILLPIFLFLYVYLFASRECWNGFTTRAFHNWLPMIRLALPGLVMIEAEVLAFEILTLASSYLGTTNLAAQSVLATVSAITFQIPFPVSIAASTRIANLIGAALPDAARTSAKVAVAGATLVGLFNVIIISSLRNFIPTLFTSDPEVSSAISKVLPLVAAFQLFDALAANCNGNLRGIGRQEIGGYVQLFCYYAVAMPISMGTTFGLGWGLFGLWSGVAIALGLVAVIEGVFLVRTDWAKAVREATARNAMG
ncbi:hypothetical protein FQN54_009941 [Arachnomyces sp. PD_36]|nr:hypothetical protein FQN54_009941 [Arachnomyces sp. PD_36]